VRCRARCNGAGVEGEPAHEVEPVLRIVEVEGGGSPQRLALLGDDVRRRAVVHAGRDRTRLAEHADGLRAGQPECRPNRDREGFVGGGDPLRLENAAEELLQLVGPGQRQRHVPGLLPIGRAVDVRFCALADDAAVVCGVADADGGVYRRTEGGWQRNAGQGWVDTGPDQVDDAMVRWWEARTRGQQAQD